MINFIDMIEVIVGLLIALALFFTWLTTTKEQRKKWGEENEKEKSN